MPKQVVAQWHSDIEQWLQQNKLSGKSVNEVLESVSIDKTVKQQLHSKFKHAKWHGHLDDCHGACLHEVAAEVGTCFILTTKNMLNGSSKSRPCTDSDANLAKTEVQRYSARQINKLVGPVSCGRASHSIIGVKSNKITSARIPRKGTCPRASICFGNSWMLG